MKQKLSKLIRRLWLRAQLGASPLVQKTVINPLLISKEMLRSVLNPFFDVYQLQGKNEAGSFTVTYIGIGTSERILRKKLFIGHSTRTRMGRVPLWQLRKIINSSNSNIVIVEADKRLISKLPRQKAIVMPPYVHLLLDVRGSWDEVKERFRDSVRYEFRLTRKYGYTYRISHSLQDFEKFYHEMYLPTMRNRHSEFVSAMSKNDAAVYFQHGFLFLIEKEGQCVAGSLCHPQQKVLNFILLGVLNADGKLMKEGVLGALNVLRLEWANQQGFETVNFLGSDPYLQSGTFQYKRKWGARVVVPKYEDKRIWLKVQHNGLAVAQFLKDNPAIVINEKEALQGFIVADELIQVSGEDRAEWQKKYATPGLENLLVYPLADLVDDPTRQGAPRPISIWDARTNSVYTP